MTHHPLDGNAIALDDHLRRREENCCPECGAEIVQDDDGAECTECDWTAYPEEEP